MDTTSPRESKQKLLDAALTVVRVKGYTATRVEDICEAAHLTKGSFFHHFKSKEDLAIEAAARWGAVTDGLFRNAPYHHHADPLDRLLAYIDFRRDLIRGAPPEFTCFVGTTVQEVHATHPSIRDACAETISAHAETLVADIEAAIARHGIVGDWTARSLALHTQAVLQGAFIMAKATQDPRRATDSIDHLRRYVELLFRRTPTQNQPEETTR